MTSAAITDRLADVVSISAARSYRPRARAGSYVDVTHAMAPGLETLAPPPTFASAVVASSRSDRRERLDDLRAALVSSLDRLDSARAQVTNRLRSLDAEIAVLDAV